MIRQRIAGRNLFLSFVLTETVKKKKENLVNVSLDEDMNLEHQVYSTFGWVMRGYLKRMAVYYVDKSSIFISLVL